MVTLSSGAIKKISTKIAKNKLKDSKEIQYIVFRQFSIQCHRGTV